MTNYKKNAKLKDGSAGFFQWKLVPCTVAMKDAEWPVSERAGKTKGYKEAKSYSYSRKII